MTPSAAKKKREQWRINKKRQGERLRQINQLMEDNQNLSMNLLLKNLNLNPVSQMKHTHPNPVSQILLQHTHPNPMSHRRTLSHLLLQPWHKQRVWLPQSNCVGLEYNNDPHKHTNCSYKYGEQKEDPHNQWNSPTTVTWPGWQVCSCKIRWDAFYWSGCQISWQWTWGELHATANGEKWICLANNPWCDFLLCI